MVRDFESTERVGQSNNCINKCQVITVVNATKETGEQSAVCI